MAISAPFSSVGQADNAYFGSESSGSDDAGGSDGGGGTGADWGQLQEADALGSAWVLAFQNEVNGDRQRWFVLRSAKGGLQALQSSGEPYNAKESDSLSDLPHYPTEDDARAAFRAWAESNASDGEQQADDEWGEWHRLREVDPWWVFSRSHQIEDRTQFLLAGKNRNGETVFLAPGATIQSEPHFYDSAEAMRSALDAYFQAVQDGDIPEAEQPTGDAPSSSEVREAVRESSRASQSVERIVEKLAGQKVLLGIVVVAAIVAYYRYNGGELTDG